MGLAETITQSTAQGEEDKPTEEDVGRQRSGMDGSILSFPSDTVKHSNLSITSVHYVITQLDEAECQVIGGVTVVGILTASGWVTCKSGNNQPLSHVTDFVARSRSVIRLFPAQ